LTPEILRQMEDAMTNYDPRRPTRPGYGGWGAGWIIVVIIVLIIIGFGWGGWYGGWYGNGGRVVSAPAHSTTNAPANTTANANHTNGTTPAENKP
jgi:hypothetical protein